MPQPLRASRTFANRSRFGLSRQLRLFRPTSRHAPASPSEPYQALPENDIFEIVEARGLVGIPNPFPLSSQGEASGGERFHRRALVFWRQSFTRPDAPQGQARPALRQGLARFLIGLLQRRSYGPSRSIRPIRAEKPRRGHRAARKVAETPRKARSIRKLRDGGFLVKLFTRRVITVMLLPLLRYTEFRPVINGRAGCNTALCGLKSAIASQPALLHMRSSDTTRLK